VAYEVNTSVARMVFTAVLAPVALIAFRRACNPLNQTPVIGGAEIRTFERRASTARRPHRPWLWPGAHGFWICRAL